MTTRRLEGRVALITGAAAGIGAACARRFASEGARLILADVQEEKLAQLCEEIGARAVTLDVQDESGWATTLDTIASTEGRLDVLVHNAATVFPAAPVHETTTQEFDRLMAVNVKSVYLGCRLAWPMLREAKGCVLNISSMAGVQGQANHAIYSATKGAINSLTKSTAADWGPHGVRINALCPSSVWTEAMAEWSQNQTEIEDLDGYFQRLHPIGYCAPSEEIATVAAFLCSDEAKYMTGAVVPVSGGSECGYRA